MWWKRLSGLFKGRDAEETSRLEQSPEISWIDAGDNQWGVPVLDVRPITQGMLSTSSNPQCAINAISFGSEDGTGFIGDRPSEARTAEVVLPLHTDGVLADGVLFSPCEMEQKWALYYHRGEIICVRSWMREVVAVAQTRKDSGDLEVTAIQGTFAQEDETPAFTVRVLDFLLRSHALDLVHPVPLPPGMEQDPNAAAMWCFSYFGNRALVATPHELPPTPPEKPLRTNSLLHIAVARGDLEAVKKQLDAGVPVDLLAQDGLTPLHWSLAQDEIAVAKFLIEQGSPVDSRSVEDATPLMNAVQAGDVAKATFLLANGADPNTADRRGFTSLHRAAETGHIEIVQLLLDLGAAPHPEVDGHTPKSLAESRGESAIAELLDAQ